MSFAPSWVESQNRNLHLRVSLRCETDRLEGCELGETNCGSTLRDFHSVEN
jgi:hypothetical protein